MMETLLSDIQVLYVIAENLEKVKEAFNKPESRLPSMSSRICYGTYHKGVYRACATLLNDDNPQALGLDIYMIPGGKYAIDKIDDWPKHISEIGPRFMEMIKKVQADESRPSIEYYKSGSVLILYLPIK